ncbi:PD-(D/E)XK nuclease family transposase [Paenibacillus sp. GCM10012307]|uniref:PD-(D/E)XK nuclease family transposase n=1 Tax=Paenibacillus sp. GCM10012307 TaxID=3317343 RepID=UPI0036194C84
MKSLDKRTLPATNSRLDIRGKTADGELINAEMQLINKYDTEKRTLFYWTS